VAAGPPLLKGSQPGDLVLERKQLQAIAEARQSPPLSAVSFVLADSATGQVLLGKEPDQPAPMASTTKVMTALLALERADLQETVVVSANALIGGSTMGLEAGEVVTIEDLLWGLLLNSGNDAAMALAEHVAGSEEAFVLLMNERAAQLGLPNTLFANPHGLDQPGHYSSARDLWRLSEEALRHPVFRTMVSTQAHVAAGHPLSNRNLLLDAYPGADGVKTGTSDQAGQCLVGSVTRDGHRALVAILGSQNRYADAEALFDHYQAFYRWAAAPQPAGATSWVSGPDGTPYRVNALEPPDLFLARWQWPLVQPRVVSSFDPIDPNQLAGEVRWYLGNELLDNSPALFTPL
jgi:D-alanyl-D-alanine carboxypeptidase (penicillin-binding protein 5/6)